MSQLSKEEEQQKLHYDEIASAYEAHYSDEYSLKYMTRFFHDAMTEGIQLKDANVLEAMCGSGSTVGYLLGKGAHVTGLDISPEVIKQFKRKWPQCEAIQDSIFKSEIPEATYDCVIIVGGLHHLQPRVNEAVTEIHRILKPGGYLCFMEPHAGSFPDLARRLWYKFDKLFEANEEAIDVDGMKKVFADRFDFNKTRYSGSAAYLLVYNSMVFRVPLSWKKYYTPAAMALEGFIGKFQGKVLSCFVVGQWRKKI